MADSEWGTPSILVEDQFLETEDEGEHQAHFWCAASVVETYPTRIKKLIRRKMQMAGFLLTVSAPTREGVWQKLIPFFERHDVRVVDGGLKRVGSIPERIRLKVREIVAYYGSIHPVRALGRPPKET
jgi:hypothetical protein